MHACTIFHDLAIDQASSLWENKPAKWQRNWRLVDLPTFRRTLFMLSTARFASYMYHRFHCITQDLSWSLHIDRVATKASQKLGFIRRNLRGAPAQCKQLAYIALVRSGMEYASTIWYPHINVHSNKLEKIQRRAARWATSQYSHRTSVTSLMDQLKWQPVIVPNPSALCPTGPSDYHPDPDLSRSILSKSDSAWYGCSWCLFGATTPVTSTPGPAWRYDKATLHWRHNDHSGVSNHQPHGCLLNRLFRRRSKETSKLPAQRASYAENASIWWRHHV